MKSSLKANLSGIFLGLLVLQALVNLVGALGPELGFDALWYHLTEAKIFLQTKSLAPIPGNLLYWSGFPRLMEMIYAFGLAIWDERAAKLIHFSFGVGSGFLVCKIGQKHLKNSTQALAATILFYSTLLVGWLSTSAYVDLALTFFILLAIYTKHSLTKILSLAAAGAIKLTAIPFSLIISGFPWAVLGAIPFWLINWHHTGNPFYPFSEKVWPINHWFEPSFIFWLSRPLRLFFDPIFRVGPVILILFIMSLTRKSNQKVFSLIRLSLFLFLVWFLLPGTDYGRFALPALAILAVVAATSVSKKNKLSLAATALVVLHALVGIVGRTYANAKYFPFILGHESKNQFLLQHLNFDFGDFCDCDQFFTSQISSEDRVLIFYIHNLYYVDFPYDHHTWAQPGTYYSHILVGNGQALPKRFGQLPLIYQNQITKVKLYQFNQVF